MEIIYKAALLDKVMPREQSHMGMRHFASIVLCLKYEILPEKCK